MKNIFRFIRCGGLLFVALCLFTGTNPLLAQWELTNGPDGGLVNCFAVSGTNLFAGTIGAGVFLSTNNGTSWTAASTGMTNTNVYALAVRGTNLFAGTDDGSTYLSTNNGTSWTAANTLFSNFRGLVTNGTYLFAGAHGGVFLSTNNGTSWASVNTGLPTGTNVTALAASGTNLFVAVITEPNNVGHVFLSTNNGASWSAASTGLPTNTYFTDLAVSGTNIFVNTETIGHDGHVFLSTNNGASWSAASTGLPTNTYFTDLVVSGTNIFVGTISGGIFLSTNSGASWSAASTGLPTNIEPYALAVSGTNLFAGTPGGVWRRPLSEMITSTSVENPSIDLPMHFSLDQNYPNPFNPTTTIKFTLQENGFTSLKVYNVLGQVVATLVNAQLKAGSYEKTFDARNLASGVYIYRLQSGQFNEVKKLMVLK